MKITTRSKLSAEALPIKIYSDYQVDWDMLIRPLKKGKYELQPLQDISVPGDAPKNFLRVKEYEPGCPKHPTSSKKWATYIAKVGSKGYPIESVTEQLITRIGQVAGFEMAQSKLCMIGGQVRFLSRFFLREGREYLAHGRDIFQDQIGTEMVENIERDKLEKHLFTFQAIEKALRLQFPDECDDILRGLVSMLVFDALVGNNDRHHGNWGVIMPLSRSGTPRFSPIFDTARGLFWQNKEREVTLALQDRQNMDAYIRGSRPLIGWDGCDNPKKFSHFDLAGLLLQEYPQYQSSFEPAIADDLIARCAEMTHTEFAQLLSKTRRDCVVRCLQLRQEMLWDALCKK